MTKELEMKSIVEASEDMFSSEEVKKYLKLSKFLEDYPEVLGAVVMTENYKEQLIIFKNGMYGVGWTVC